MIGSEFAGTLSKNLGSSIGKLDATLQSQLSQLKDLAVQKSRAQAEAAISKQVQKSTGVDVSGALSSIDPNNLASSAQSAGTSLAIQQAQSQGEKALNDLKNKAPQMKKIVELCKKIKRVLNSIQGPIEKIAALIAKITLIITLAKNILKLLSALLKLLKANPTLPIAPPLPVPIAPGATVPGIPMIYPTQGAITTTNQVASKIQKYIDKIADILDSLSKVLTIVTASILAAVGILRLIKPLLNSICPDSLTDSLSSSTDQPQVSTSALSITSLSTSVDIDKLIQKLTSTIPSDLVETENSYKGYTFEVIEDKTQTSANGKVNKRYAIAKNSSGIEVFRSQSSFATDKQILIAELKFKIDNDLINSSVQESI